MNIWLTITLHGALFTAVAACFAWLLQSGVSAARAAAGWRAVMLGALVLMAGEALLLKRPHRDNPLSVIKPGAAAPLPESREAATGEFLEASTAYAQPEVAAQAERPLESQARWELSAQTSHWLGAVWLVGVVFVLGCWLAALRARQRLKWEAQPVGDAAWRALLPSFAGGKEIALLQHHAMKVPCAWNGVILLPPDAEKWSPAERRMVLAHECAHLHRRDPSWLSVSQCFLALQWFNPLAWLAVRRHRSACELAADDAVLRGAHDAPAYASLLVECARHRGAWQASVCSMASHSPVSGRVERILSADTDRTATGKGWRALSAVIMGLCAAATFFLVPPLRLAAEEAAPSQEPAQSSEESPASPPPAAEKGESEKQPEQSSSGNYDWKLQQFDGRDYVSAGNIAAFYEFPRQQREGDRMVLSSSKLIATFAKGSSRITMNNINISLSHPVLERDGLLWVAREDLAWVIHPILKPNHAGAKIFSTVIIDPGHGGEDGGGEGLHGKESVYTLDTAFRLRTALQKAGLKVILTRDEDKFVSRADRIALANEHPDAVFVSIHFNAATRTSQGLETFALTAGPHPPEGLNEAEITALRSAGMAMGVAVHANCLFKLRSTDGGVQGNPQGILAGLTIPGILVEGGFLTHQGESARIHTPEYREQLAQAIAGGLRNYRTAIVSRQIRRR